MKDFFLYKRETEKPHFVLVVGDKAWIIPFLAPFEPAKKRLAVEVVPGDIGITRPFGSVPGLVESGKVFFNRRDNGKIDFTVSESSGSLMKGGFVFVMPPWGVDTKRKLWVIIKSRKKI